MKFTSNLLRVLLLILLALVSCAQFFRNASQDSMLGNCLDYNLTRSPLMVKEFIRKPNNQSSKVRSEFHQSSWIIRYPMVRIDLAFLCLSHVLQL